METGYFCRRWPLTVYATSLSAFGVVEGELQSGASVRWPQRGVQRWLESA